MRGLRTGRAEDVATFNNITSIVPQRAADCSRRSSLSNCHRCQFAHSFFVLSTENSGTQAGMEGEQTVGRSPLPRVATCGLRDRTAVAMATNKAVFV